MTWPTREIDSWETFERFTTMVVLPYESRNNYLLRGQANAAWKLTPSLNRLFKEGVSPDQMLSVENEGVKQFQQQAHLHLPPSVIPGMSMMPESAFVPEWWALMQHYSAPTRMLDWTISPYVALYFAVERESESDGAIYLVNTNTVSAIYHRLYPNGVIEEDLICSPTAPEAVLVWTPIKSTERMVAQQGYFTFGTLIASDHEHLIAAQCSAASNTEPKAIFNERWIVPAKRKIEFLRRLRMMNIGAHSLFPGIDGLGRSVAEIARLAVPS